jgi:predicted permease
MARFLMELALRIIGIITPVLIISAMGYAYARLRKPDMTWINRLSTDLLFPLLIYTSMASKDFNIREFLPMIVGSLLLLHAALPPAVMNYILADRYQQEPGLVSAIVVVGNIASIFFVPLSLYLAF